MVRNIKLAAAIGAWVGWQSLPFALAVAATSALVFFLVTAICHTRRQIIPFGPSLVFGAWAAWFIRPPLFHLL